MLIIFAQLLASVQYTPAWREANPELCLVYEHNNTMRMDGALYLQSDARHTEFLRVKLCQTQVGKIADARGSRKK